MGFVFISYRRSDNPHAVDRICDALAAHFGKQNVFRDINDIPLGANFPQLLQEKLAKVSTVLVVIGPHWLEILKNRKNDPNHPVDYVREEIRTALESQLKVIPVTVDGASLPLASDLADFPDLLPLLSCHGAAVRPVHDFAPDIERVIQGLATPILDEAIGSVLGDKYKLLGKIADGGMGTVYAAEQLGPVPRQVAIKLIKLGMDTREVLARFDAEQHALAVMDHPNIARVLDAGTTPRGRPFFAMELVNGGVPITEYCDARKLPTRERLALFETVCRAVQHAHQKGIIHRDIKPSNILVEVIGDQPVPKVIDFGLAKAMGQKLTAKTLFSESGRRIGTLEYMSPEQAEGKHGDIDTRSDIYSLGVVLYELLAGNPPFTRQQLENAGEDEMRRVIREVEPPVPSTRLSSSDTLPSIAAKRNLEPARLTKLVRGELDWIAMKALAKDRTHRYETALGLARDVERYLADEVVEARPPSVGYRAQKFLRKHRRSVVLGLVAMISVVGGLTIGLIREAVQRQIAEDRERDAVKAKGEAESATLRAQEAQNRAEKARDRTREALDAMTSEDTSDSLATQKAISPEQKKFLTDVLKYYKEFAGEKGDDEFSRKRIAGSAYRVGLIEARLSRNEESAAAFRLALDGFTALVADFPAVPEYRSSLAKSHNNLGLLLSDLGERVKAEEHHRKALAIRQKLATESPNVHEYRSRLALSHNNLGVLLNGIGKRAEAEEQFRTALAIREKLVADYPRLPEYRSSLAKSYGNLGLLLRALGKPVEAQDKFRTALDIQEKLVADDPVPEYRSSLAKSYGNLGHLLDDLGQQMEAEEQYRKALVFQHKLASEFPTVPEYRSSLAASHHNLGALLSDREKRAQAEEQYRNAVTIFEKLATDFPALPEYRSSLAKSHNNLGFLLASLRKFSEGEEQLHKALAVQEKLAVDFSMIPEYRQKVVIQLYNFACFCAIASGKLASKKQEYADRAMELLQKAVKAGLNSAKLLTEDTNLDPLRDRADFQALLESLAPAKPKPKEK